MIDLAIISGTGFYDLTDLEEGENLSIETRYGLATVRKGILGGKKVAFIARHGKKHGILPNLINYRANFLALKKLETKAVVSTTVCGVLDSSLPLAKLAVFEDMYFLDNRLPNGEVCTIYDEIGQKERGHYIFDKPFSQDLREQVIAAAEDPITDAVYAYANGPRFNSRSEINMLSNHATFVSQTAGPEIILAGELEMPCALLGFGVDYANGVSGVPTPVDVLKENIQRCKEVFESVMMKLIKNFQEPGYQGFIYRFE